jgi:hypothetical protein
MSSVNDPTPSEAIQAASPHATSTATQALPPPEPSSIPLPPRPKRAPLTLEQLNAWTKPLDVMIAASVVVLAFLAASFAARNNELLMHLAAGRALLDGTYKLGADPFSYTTSGVYWVNHSWLWDGITYLIYQYLGGPALIVVKALMIALLAGFMLAVRRRGQSLWIPGFCALVAVAILCQRLLLHPVVVSYLFLGITLYLLQKPAQPAEAPSGRRGPAPGKRRHLWLLPILFLFWVNLDQWFFLGPLTVALWWLGEVIQDQLAPVKEGQDHRLAGDNRSLGLVLIVGLLACLVNPHHIHAFALPPQLSESGASVILQNDYFFGSMFWGAIDYYDRGANWSVAGIAFLVLLGLGLLSFAANYKNWRGWRITIWASFAALAIYHVRAVPFFAVVGGSIAALNFQDAVVHYFGTTPRLSTNWRQWAIAGRVLTLGLAAIMILISWPGWLLATMARGESVGRNVAWRVEWDPSLEKAARQLQQWHTDGVLGPDDHGVSLSPDVAFALAWFAPDEKGFMDSRLTLFDKAAVDFVEANQALVPDRDRETVADLQKRLDRIAQVLRQNKANHLIVHFADWVRELNRYGPLFSAFEADPSKQFTLVYLDGRTAIFSWDDPKKPGPQCRLTEKKISDDKLAFGPQSAAPVTDRPTAPESLAFYERFLHPRQARPLAADEAAMHLHVLDAKADGIRLQGVNDWLYAQVGGLVGCGAAAPVAGEPYFRAVLGVRLLEHARMNKPPDRKPDVVDQLASLSRRARYNSTPLPVSAPLLAVRACRRALLENPNDATTWFQLQTAYATLEYNTRERDWMGPLWTLQSIRQVQRILALNHAVLIDPDHEAAHEVLGGLFEQMSIPGQGGGGYFDLALDHRKEQLRITKERGPRPREKLEEYERRVQPLEDRVQKLEEYVRKAQDDYYNGQVSRSTMKAKAELALSKGLGKLARDELLKSYEVSAEPDAIPLQLNLMIMTGAIEGEKGIRVGLDSFEEQAKESGKQPNMGRFGQEPYTLPTYEWLQVLAAAASGDYRVADEFLAPIVKMRERVHDELLLNRSRRDALYLTSSALLDTQVTPMTLLHGYERAYQLESLKILASIPAQVGDIYTLRGILALEAGDNKHAEELFRKVVSLKDYNFMPIANYYLELMEANK